MKREVLVGDMSRNGKFYNFSRNKGFNRPAAQVDHWGTCREMGSASGRHVAKWDVLVDDMSRNGMFYWAFGQTILNLSRLLTGSLEKNMRATANS